MIIHSETGNLFEAGNIDDLRGKLTELWNNEVLTKIMGAKARKHVYDIVNFDVHWGKLNSIINKITNNGN